MWGCVISRSQGRAVGSSDRMCVGGVTTSPWAASGRGGPWPLWAAPRMWGSWPPKPPQISTTQPPRSLPDETHRSDLPAPGLPGTKPHRPKAWSPGGIWPPPHMVEEQTTPKTRTGPSFHLDRTVDPGPSGHGKKTENIWRKVLQRGPDMWAGAAGPEGSRPPGPGLECWDQPGGQV